MEHTKLTLLCVCVCVCVCLFVSDENKQVSVVTCFWKHLAWLIVQLQVERLLVYLHSAGKKLDKHKCHNIYKLV